MLDTRAFRTRFNAKNPTFMEPAARAQVLNWLKNLQGPGVLSIGDSIVTNASTWFERTFHTMGDVSLGDYARDFHDLWKAIISAPHDILLLTGDVHYGSFGVVNVSTSPLMNASQGRRGVVYECISSALALLSSARSAYDKAQKFDITGLENDGEFLMYQNYFAGAKGAENYATISFTKRQDGVEFSVRFFDPLGRTLWQAPVGAKYVLS
jgi:hypothetical protein